MEKRILTYRAYMDKLLEQENLDWEQVRKEHLVQVGFFQHERLIHLIVTVTFALLTMLAICVSFVTLSAGSPGAMSWLAVVVALLILLVPYIRHYYILENEVQKMYRQYDRLTAKCGFETYRQE